MKNLKARHFISVLCVIVGIGLIASGFLNWSDSVKTLELGGQSLQWPTTRGLITASGFKTKVEHERYETFFKYKCEISYDYQVGSRVFTGTRVSYATAGDHYVLDKKLVEYIHARFRKGDPVEVHYDKTAPENAVLIPGVEAEHVSLPAYDYLAIGLLLLAVGPLIGTFRPGPYAYVKAILLSMPIVVLGLGLAILKPILVRNLVPPSSIIHLRENNLQ